MTDSKYEPLPWREPRREGQAVIREFRSRVRSTELAGEMRGTSNSTLRRFVRLPLRLKAR